MVYGGGMHVMPHCCVATPNPPTEIPVWPMGSERCPWRKKTKEPTSQQAETTKSAPAAKRRRLPDEWPCGWYLEANQTQPEDLSNFSSRCTLKDCECISMSRHCCVSALATAHVSSLCATKTPQRVQRTSVSIWLSEPCHGETHH